MRYVIFKSRCERDLKLMKRRGKDSDDFLDVARMLAAQGHLSSEYQPHKLSGKYEGYWECHIESDWLLIYAVTKREIFLVRTGTHADLFE